MISISIDPRRVNRKIRSLQDGLKPKQVAGALNAALRSTRVQARKMTTSVLNLRGADVYKSGARNTKGDLLLMDLASTDNLSGQIVASGKRPGLHKYRVRPYQKGVAARTWKGLGPEYVHHGFIPPSQGGVAFKRVGKPRMPIRVLTGPSVADALDPATKQIQDYAGDRFEVEYLRKLRGLLARG